MRPISYAGRDSHPHDPFGPLASEASASAFRHQRIALVFVKGTRNPLSGYRVSNPGPQPWRGCALPLSYIRMEPARRIELRLPPYRGGVLPFSLNRHSWRSWTRTMTTGVKARQAADYLTLQREPPSGAAPDLRLYRSRAAAARGGNVPSARFERALPGASCQCLLPLGYEGPEPPPGADPGHPLYESGAAAVRGGEAARRGFEPRQPRPERGVLPVRRTGIGTGGAIRTRTAQDLSLLSAAIGLRPRAPPEARTPFPGLRVQCITCHACGA
jgi:hypothetical protein